jgi:hypothetical protein
VLEKLPKRLAAFRKGREMMNALTRMGAEAGIERFEAE